MNFGKIQRPQEAPRKLCYRIDFGTNRKRVYMLLLVVNSNLDHILHRCGLNVEN